MKQLINKLYHNRGIRYVFFGGLTTLVNLISFTIMAYGLGVDTNIANMISIVLAILFAYVVNKLFVFEHRTENWRELLKEFCQFIGARMATMVVEVIGVMLLIGVACMAALPAKLIIQVVVMILNYVFSKLFVFNDKEETLDEAGQLERKYRRKMTACGFAIPLLVMTAAFIVIGVWPFGDHCVLIIDSIHQYLPFFTEMQQKLQDSSSMLFSNGGALGFNFWSTYAYYLASPFNFLLAYVSMVHVVDFMDWLIVFKIACCGGIFAWYLCKRQEKRGAAHSILPVAFACMYALSGFMIGYYFNIMWLDSIAILPVMLYGIEQIIEGKSGRVFGLSLFYGLYCNYYIGFMLCIFACLYWLISWVSAKDFQWKRLGKSAVSFAWYALLAGGMSAILLIPAYMGLTLTESAESTFPTTFKFYSDGITELTSHFALVTPMNISDTQEGLNTCCGCIVLILTVLYLLDSQRKLRERLGKILLVGFLYLSFHLNVLNYIWHGFHTQNGLPNRFAFLYIAMLLIMGFDVCCDIKKIHWSRILIAVIPGIGFVVAAYCNQWGEQKWYVYVVTLALLGVYALTLLCMRFFQKQRQIFTARLGVFLILEMVGNSVYGVIQNGNVGRGTYQADQIAYQALIKEEQPEQLFYRSDIDSQRMRNEAMYMGGGGVVLFNSVMSGAMVDFCKAIGMEARTNKNGYNGLTKLMNDVLGIRYVVSKTVNEGTLYQMDAVAFSDPLELYKNENALSLAFMVNRDIKFWDIKESVSGAEIQNQFVKLATGLDGIYKLDRTIEAEDGVTYGMRIPANKQVYMQLYNNVEKVALVTPEHSKDYSRFNAFLYDFGCYATEQEGSFTLTLKESQTGTIPVDVYTCQESAYIAVHDALAKNQLEISQYEDGLVKGTIQADKDGTMLLTYSYDPGWNIYVDGVKTEVYKVGDALMGVDVAAGSHTITMKYSSPGLLTGALLTLLSAVLLAITILMENKRGKEEQDGNNIL